MTDAMLTAAMVQATLLFGIVAVVGFFAGLLGWSVADERARKRQ